MKVIKAVANYTGGGIYEYGGQLDDGNYILTFDDFEDWVLVLNANPIDNEDAYNSDWQDAHTVTEITGTAATEIWKQMLDKAIEALENGERMNASASELEDRRERL